MDLGSISRRRPRTRARVVCVACHSRKVSGRSVRGRENSIDIFAIKVKCDLQQQPGGTCGNCQRLGQRCRTRELSRPIPRASAPFSAANLKGSFSPRRRWPEIRESPNDALHRNRRVSRGGEEQEPGDDDYDDDGGGGGEGALTPTNLADMRESIVPYASRSSLTDPYRTTVSRTLQADYLNLCGALDLPSPLMEEALQDNYFEHVYRRCAVVDRIHLSQKPSVLLLQAVCLTGSSMRQMGPEYFSTCELLYIKVKTLLITNHEKDLRTILQSLCLVSCWNTTPMQVVSMESAYHWLSIAIRLLFQAGLHREETYVTAKEPRVLRRIAWYIYTMEKSYSCGLGLPCMIRPCDFHVRPLAPEDFDNFDEKSQLFVELNKVNSLRARMLEVHWRKGENDCAEAAYDILRSLREWIDQLPDQFRLYRGNDPKRHYRRAVYELHIHYFVVIATFFHLCGYAVRASIANPAALVASSCMARLYEEVLYREELGLFLPIHNWYLSIACLPQIHALSGSRHADATSEEELGILRRGLQTMAIKWPQANNLRTSIDRLYERRVSNFQPNSYQNQTRVSDDRDPDGRSECTHDGVVVDNSSSVLNRLVCDLFPFPTSISPRMDIFEAIEPIISGPEGATETTVPAAWDEDYQFDWTLNLLFDPDSLTDGYVPSSSMQNFGKGLAF
ncbi:uncharacterized protein Z520_05526 [Fonsecaea multimorphosa CBS 102226]|uniref:Xylanolytic transcriptional activator regulatory domain-containing protein n=1 Tax=Fonsecaea multimorphosa CBS 102226 TaxID=1442371 RepID=A0A0D2HAY8_9EURO|nr:uncharacterized protein Z520_05526 [Fonsecaea multimorphosa CBS 102226]KIX99065.1 hypothetical protein Z520_05526 [Fonsecaea multimorphosa CBS 102226]